MRRLLVAGCLTVLMLGMAGVAQAQDDDSFKGFYGGLTLGYDMGRSHARTSTVFVPGQYFAASSVNTINNLGIQPVNPVGLAGGVTAGYNYQPDGSHFVAGIETDFSLLKMRSLSSVSATYPCCSPTRFTLNQSVSTNWLYTLRPRVGYAGGPVMGYITGGWAATHVKYDQVFTDTFATARESSFARRDRGGYAVGGGVEAHIGHHLSAKLEYLYAAFAHVTLASTNLTAFTPRIAFPGNVFTSSVDLHMHVVRAGINFGF